MPEDGAGLFAVAEKASFDLGGDWFDLLTRYGQPDGSVPQFYTCSRAGEVQCVLPLWIRGGRASSLTTYYSSLFRPLLAAEAGPDDFASLIRGVVADLRCASVRLNAMDPAHRSYAIAIEGMRKAGLKAFPFFDFANWYLPVTGSYDAYFAGLSSRVRNTVRRREKKFFNALHGETEIISDMEDVERALAAWDRIYRSSWKKPEPFPRFVPELIRLCARRGWLRFGLAHCDGTPVAAQIWIVNGRRAAIYKLAYDEAYAAHSVGTILTAHLMRYVIDEDKVSEVDYLIGDDAYKRDWMSHRRERMGIIAFNRRTPRGLLGSVFQTVSSLRRRGMRGG